MMNSDLPDVTFYHVETEDEFHYLRFVCRLVDKAFRSSRQGLLIRGTQEQYRFLEDWLWTQLDTSFLPHQHSHEPYQRGVRIFLGDALPQDAPPFAEGLLLLNLAPSVPDWRGITRILDTVFEKTKEAARARYRAYREAGCPLTYHRLAS